MIEFTSINAFNKGQRESFEELICVLAKRESPERGIEYQSNDGCGGDGGVEAIWLLDNGKKIGYQAKFFLSLGDSQWAQMDESVKQAIKVHPELQTYIIALPKNLTPERGTKGKSQWEKWEDRLKKWKLWAEDVFISIEFQIWSETNLQEMLLREGNDALIKHWFGEIVLNDNWFQRQVEVAVKVLEDRFNPNDHVEVEVETLFDTLTRGSHTTKQIINDFNELRKSRIPHIEFSSSDLIPDVDVLLKVNKLWEKLVEFKQEFVHDFNRTWNTNSVTQTLEDLRKYLWTLENQYRFFDKNALDDEREKSKVDIIIADLRKVSSAVNLLHENFSNRNFDAEAQQCAMVYGPAGTGKSHILGQIAEQRVKAGLPTILLLGQNFSNSVFWEQLGALLGLEERTADNVLGLLNAAGERIGERTLLLFDAINEGIGSNYWRNNLIDFIGAIKNYPYLSVVFSCREEYLPYAIPQSLSPILPKFQVRGFSTPQELESAANRYLDNKGIARPNTPWLSPEFSNPLFLKSTSEALHAKGIKEFPRGLKGISQIMALYLDALSWRTGIETESSNTILRSIKQCIKTIANKMATDSCDYVELEQAIALTGECFKGRTPPEGKTWLDVLIQVSLFRRDPPPYSKDLDPFDTPPELVRFTFQRFQDHLMATALVEKIAFDQVNMVFDENGPLNFLFYDGNLSHSIRYEYAGLVSALSIVYPEKLKLEFAKTLPNWKQHWQEDQILQEGFRESFKWRNLSSFSESTRELLNLLEEHYVEPLGLLLEVSMTVGYPFNALRLHKYLKQYSMPERDSQWTRWINWASREEFSQIDRIVSWALSVSEGKADLKHIKLASLVLAWSLSSSHMTLRDRATKALTSLFLLDSDSFIYVLDKMYDCDDPYILERLYAAAFGACCIDQSFERLVEYAKITFTKVFADRKPPVALLTRDYALGIIELAEAKNALNDEVVLGNCYHPFKSAELILDLNTKEVKAVAEACGGKEIFNSASSEWGDFGKYSIPGRVGGFLDTPLVQAKPISKSERKRLFVQAVIQPDSRRALILKEFEEVSKAASMATFIQFTQKRDKEENLQKEVNYEEEKKNVLSRLESLLNKDENIRLKADYFSDGGYEEFKKVDIQQCRLWITNRAYKLGWNSKLFNRDGYGSNYSRHGNDLERIGKKYQRIALDELQARLADHYWALQYWPEEPSVYRYSEQNFRRNLEPTILPFKNKDIALHSNTERWMTEPNIKLPVVDEEKLKQWPFDQDPTQLMGNNIMRTDGESKPWIVLYDYNNARQKYDEPCAGEHGLRNEEFRFIYCVFVKNGQAKELAEYLHLKQNLDVGFFRPVEYIDGPFLREAHWRGTWANEKNKETLSNAPKGCEFTIPVTHYLWESHLDKSLPEGFSMYMPQRWFAEELKVSMSIKSPQQWLNELGNTVVQTSTTSEGRDAVLIDESELNSYAENFGIEPIWILIAERSSFPNGSNSEFCGRRSEGVIWRENGQVKELGWNKDTRR
ncbi:hypothetical protein WN093_00795 [Gammaproteobacteria bacterium AS21]